MSSLFRIDKCFVPKDTQNQGIVVLPHFEEMLKMKNDELLLVGDLDCSNELQYDEDGNLIIYEDSESPVEQEVIYEDIDDEITKKEKKLLELNKELQDAKLQCDIILNTANEKAEKIIDDASKQGYNDGFNKGYNEGISTIEKQRIDEQTEFKNNITKFTNARDEMYSHVEEGVVDLSVSIAQKIINIEINKNDVVYKQLVRRTLTMLKNQSNVVLHINKNDFEKYFVSMDSDFCKELQQADIEIKQNMSLQENEIHVTTDYGNVNAGIKTQLQQIEILLKNS